MPRIARIVVPGVAHPITQRGNNRQKVFFSDADRALYLALLKAAVAPTSAPIGAASSSPGLRRRRYPG
jgi:putative transposase